MNEKSIFSLLEGQWILKRKITSKGDLIGTADFIKIDYYTLHYEERCTLTLNTNQVITDVKKRYLYKLENDYIAVYFDDGVTKGKLFHFLKFDKDKISVAQHYCPPDSYETVTKILSPNKFESICNVTGPNKNYKILSIYSKNND